MHEGLVEQEFSCRIAWFEVPSCQQLQLEGLQVIRISHNSARSKVFPGPAVKTDRSAQIMLGNRSRKTEAQGLDRRLSHQFLLQPRQLALIWVGNRNHHNSLFAESRI